MSWRLPLTLDQVRVAEHLSRRVHTLPSCTSPSWHPCGFRLEFMFELWLVFFLSHLNS